MKALLFTLCSSIFFIISCNKAPEEIMAVTTVPVAVAKPFTKVYLFGAPGNWGGGICSFGWVMIREDSNSIVYHSLQLPTGVTITSTPVWVNIKYHDTINYTHCYDAIVVDSLKF